MTHKEELEKEIISILAENGCGEKQAMSILDNVFSLLDSSGAIACYFASPLALREQYGTEMKINLSERMKWYREDGIAIELFDYIEYLEGLLCKVEGE